MRNKKRSTSGKRGENESLPLPDQYIADQPTKAAAVALGAGFLLTFLPLGKIAGILIDLAFALARPMLLCFGVVKLLEFCHSASLCGGGAEPTNTKNHNYLQK